MGQCDAFWSRQVQIGQCNPGLQCRGSPRDGRFIENIGTYDPRKAGENFKVDLERAKVWIKKGAQPSDTVRSILKKAEQALSKAA